MQEGQVWETAMSAAHFQLDHLCAIIDYNKLQSDDLNANIMGIEPLADKWRSFGWYVQEIDGHDFAAIGAAVVRSKQIERQPQLVIAHTIKGKGVSFMEGVAAWHGSVKIKNEELRVALCELGADEGQLEAYLNGNFWK